MPQRHSIPHAAERGQIQRVGDDRSVDGLIIFYDAAVLSKAQLQDQDALCRASGRSAASWLFELVNGRWQAAKDLFDFGTDTLRQ
jgi:hypothetical protein